ncbi:glyoxalase/bleomycin resistance protein/dioxygenase superfamily protein [Ilumatobacter fluminis]|uniref:Glyoxalase/bleomycin resistance protein/dioxygenase superfamily protein n=1 Tax=Ilumatobacter fluminis TaxID=467091 RepID=A0A4R7I476_9ACTN|nr:VOC family protein [Ilumatobacter fluminis]TDT18295.1 glyoxalase/bleomycin resistance protein/dioxygenase superfamily protein [Ilumatobacter fluminis]
MLIGLHHVGRAVADVATVADDHAAITGWPVTHTAAGDSPLCAGRNVGATALLHGPNGWLELVGATTGEPTLRSVNVAGVAHSSIQTGNTTPIDTRLADREITRHDGPIELGTGFTYLYVRDAEHDIIEIEGAPHAPADLDPWLSHGAIVSPDIDRLAASYATVLDAEPTPPIRLAGHSEFDRGTGLAGVDVRVTFVRVPNGSVEMWQYDAPAPVGEPVRDYEAVGAGHLAFETTSIDDTVERALANGFALADETIEVDGLRIARMTDLDGNWVEFVEFDDLDDPCSLRTRPDLRRPAKMDALLAAARS